MNANSIHLVAACLALVLLTVAVGGRMLMTRVGEMRARRIHPQAVASAAQMAAQMHDTRAADNFRNLFEVPVLFYALCAVALATRYTPQWLVLGAWLYVVLRVIHSAIHCTYNTVLHRLAAFASSFLLLVGLWIAFFAALPS